MTVTKDSAPKDAAQEVAAPEEVGTSRATSIDAVDYRAALDGGWIAVVKARRLLVIDSRSSIPVTDVLRSLGSDAGFRSTVELVARGGLASLPAFALVDWSEGGLRTLLRGDVTCRVTDDAGEHEVEGVGVSTWTERSFPRATGATIRVDGATETPAAALPLADGAAIVSSLRVSTTVATTMSPEASSTALTVALSHGSAESHDPTTEDTVFRPVADEASGAPEGGVTAEATTPEIPTPPLTEPDSAVGDTIAGDHDGNTVIAASIRKLRAGRSGRADPIPARRPPETEPEVVLELSNGIREPLTQPIVVGRAPSASGVSEGRMPRLLTVGSVEQDISRNHARFALEGGTVVVTDLHSRNGTLVILPGKDPQKLRAGEPTAVIIGTTVDLGGGVTFRVGRAAPDAVPQPQTGIGH